jgi:hypothetical protein
MMFEERYRALIRWRSADRRWEVETDHRGFPSAEDAALFANGLSAYGAARLWMADGQIALELTNGRRVSDVDAVAIWHLRDEPVEMPEEARFQRVMMAISELSRLGLDGPFEPWSFVVVDPLGVQLAADIEVDLKRWVVRVTVGPVDPPDGSTALLIPRA